MELHSYEFDNVVGKREKPKVKNLNKKHFHMMRKNKNKKKMVAESRTPKKYIFKYVAEKTNTNGTSTIF
jgi:hypothetical protein